MMRTFFTESRSRETHSRDGDTYIKRSRVPRRGKLHLASAWILVVRGAELATFFRREDARVHVRSLKGRM